MVRISTFYDVDEKEQFFMVRGDEGYARSTKTVLEEVSVATNTTWFDLTLRVNVLRDVGTGSIGIYDNDLLVYSINDWSSEDNARTIVIPQLGYDIDHNFVAKYIGNKSSSPSSSNTITVNIHDTNRTTSTLTAPNRITGMPHRNITIPITLTNGENIASYNRFQEIIAYYDGDKINAEFTTDNNGIATIIIPDSGDDGLHTFTAELVGSNNLSSSTITKDVSVGYKMEWIDFPEIAYAGIEYECILQVTNFFDDPLVNTNVTFEGHVGLEQINERYPNPLPLDENGRVSIITEIDELTASLTVHNTEYTSYKTANRVYPQSVSITPSTPVLSKGNDTIFTVQANPPVKDAPIIIDGEIALNLTTDATGRATFTYTGNGKGGEVPKTFTVAYGTVMEVINIEDYIERWMTGYSPFNENAYLSSTSGTASLLKLANTFRMHLSASYSIGSMIFGIMNPQGGMFAHDFVFVLKGVTSSMVCDTSFSTSGNQGKVTKKLNNSEIKVIRQGRIWQFLVDNVLLWESSSNFNANNVRVNFSWSNGGYSPYIDFKSFEFWELE